VNGSTGRLTTTSRSAPSPAQSTFALPSPRHPRRAPYPHAARLPTQSRPRKPFARRPSPPSPRQMVTWHLARQPPQQAHPLPTCQTHPPSSTPHLSIPCTRAPSPLNLPPCYPNPIPSPLRLRNPTHLCQQQLARQSRMNLVISRRFAQASRTPGAVSTTAVVVLVLTLAIQICT
jgi:hypothetical protein